MSTAIYEVPGVSCNHCKQAIEGEVSGVAGVTSVDVDVEAKEVTVVGDASEESVRAAIDEAGYEVEAVRAASPRPAR